MSDKKCRNCGSPDIDLDNGRGDAVCTNCGTVLENTIIVSEVQFEENAFGASKSLGQFVSADSKGGATSFGASFHAGIGVESREITIKKARQGISLLCQQLKLNLYFVEIALKFFGFALNKQLTRGRKSTHIQAACVYLACRIEKTPHLLIDISDVLQICCYELGRTYLRLQQAFDLNIPIIDPSLYIDRFAHRLDFGDKVNEVATTASRLVQRMKRDNIHYGRRPSGLCGAALLIAARMHDFHRLPADIVRIVKVHESTVRKRMMEFGETPSSALTLDEFMTIDLEAEQDPPAFKEARKKDKERLIKLSEKDNEEFTELQKEIDKQLEKEQKKSRKRKIPKLNDEDEIETDAETTETNTFIRESTLELINNCMDDTVARSTSQSETGLGPDIASICFAPPIKLNKNENTTTTTDSIETEELDLDGINDDEIDTYIMTPNEAKYKGGLWNQINASYILEQKARDEKLAKEKEEGKPEKKKRRTGKRKAIGPSDTPGEAIEKMLQEKKISKKINYDILKNLNSATSNKTFEVKNNETIDNKSLINRDIFVKPENISGHTSNMISRKAEPIVEIPAEETNAETDDNLADLDIDEADYYEDAEPTSQPEHTSLASMLNQQEEYYGYDEY